MTGLLRSLHGGTGDEGPNDPGCGGGEAWTARSRRPGMQVPFSFEIAELFKIQDGKIMRIEALVIPAPYGMTSGWPAR